MSEASDRIVKVTAEERAHPALRKLARVCIALALNAVEKKTLSPQDVPAGQLSGSPSGGESTVTEQADG
jgi:hypothetical protein